MKARIISKRGFIMKSSALHAGGSFGSYSSFPEKGEKSETNFIYRAPGKTGIRVPVVSAGILPFDSPALVKAILSSGISLIDTACEHPGGRHDTVVDEPVKVHGREKLFPEAHHALPGLNCSGCDQCRGNCIRSFAISHIMPAYRYAFGHHDAEKAHPILAPLRLPEDPCIDCRRCTISSSKGFDIRTKVTQMALTCAG